MYMKKEEIKKENFLKNFKQTFRYIKKHKFKIAIYMVCMLLISAFGIIVPYLTAQELLAITGTDFNNLIKLALLVFMVEISHDFVSFYSDYIAQKIYNSVYKDIEIDMAKETLRLKTSEINNNSSGLFIDRLTGDARSIANIYGQLSHTLINVITNSGIIIAIFLINRYIFALYVINAIIYFIFNKIRLNKWFKNNKKYRKLQEKGVGLFGELVRGEQDIKVLNAEEPFINNITTSVTERASFRFKVNIIDRFLVMISGIIIDLSNLLLIILGIFLITKQKLSIANFIILYNYRNGFINLLSSLTFFNERLKDFNLSSARVFEILDSDKFAKESFGKEHIKHIKGDFEFKNVSFSYDKKRKILKDVSFKVPANHTVSFVGKSGAGKSTIFALLAKLYDNYEGEILIDGHNIRDLDKDSLRGNISIINQDPYIFNMSIKDNFKVIKEDITDKEIVTACKMGALHDYIMSLPNKYDTVVGEGGVILSGGQKQRLAIARAFAQKTEIILFDEATSALDNETQNEITEAINNLKKDYTILIIAHRLSTVINSDKIIFIDDGKIIDEGTHEELLKRNAEYKKLYELERTKDKTK